MGSKKSKMSELLGRANAKEMLDYFPEELLKEWESDLPQESQWFDEVEKERRRLHNPDNLYDIQRVIDGEKVRHKISGRIAIAFKEISRPTNSEPIESIRLEYEDGEMGWVYANQIERV